MIARHLAIRGRVQGVGFRYHLRAEALRHGVSGWVRNRRDGSVEAIVQGDEGAVDRIIDWARRGPGSAQVTELTIDDVPLGDYAAFETRPTE